MKLVTIVGFAPFESGKTRLAARLVRGLRERGVEVNVVKPIGSHNLWQQHFSLEYSMEHGVLVGGDAIRLARAMGSREPSQVQPVDLLLAPPDVARYLARLRDYLFSLESLISQVVLIRVSSCGEKGIEHIHLRVDEHIEALPPTIRGVVEELASRLQPKPVRVDRDALSSFLRDELVIAADVCSARLLAGAEIGIIESFNDIVVPVPIATRSEYFVAVAPGRAVVYRGEEVVKAASLVAGIRPGSIRSSEVLHLVKPVKILDVEFVYSDEYVGEDVEKLIDLLLTRT